MKKQIHKYRVGYAIYRRNVPLNNVVYGEKDGKVQYLAEEDETRVEETCAIDEDNFNDIDEPNRKTYKISYNSKNKFWSATALVPKSLMGRFLGAQGSNKKKIEQSTECDILVPERSKKHAPITIKSTAGSEQVERCLDQIEMFVVVQRRQARPTHFVSLALQSNELVENYNTFCTLIKNSSAVPDESKQPELFMPTVRLHLTLCMLGLLSDIDKKKAAKALSEVVENEVRPMLRDEPLTINIKGLSHFGDEDPSETRVLFAKVSGVQLVDIAKVIIKKMISIGLAKEETRDLTLHMTIMNSKYVKKANDRNYTFDANLILRDFSNYEFGSVQVSDVKICALSIDSSTGNYQTAHSAPFHP